MTIPYDNKAGLFWTALRRSHTVAPSVLLSAEFWIFFLLHIVVFIVSHWDKEWVRTHRWFMQLDWDSVKIVSGITTFFEVFYANQCYSRYIHLYNTTRGMINHVHDLCHYFRVFLGEAAIGHSRLGTRYVIVAMVLHFYEMKGRTSHVDLAELIGMGLLRDSELTVLRATPSGQRSKAVLAWCSYVATKGCTQANTPPQALRRCTDLTLLVNASQQEIVDTLSLPVPFQYFHLLSAMITMNLILWAFIMGMNESFFSPLIYFFSSFIFIGMMELSSQLSDPFGIDEVDFPIDQWMRQCTDMMVEMVETDFPGGRAIMSSLANEEPAGSMKGAHNIVFLQEPDAKYLDKAHFGTQGHSVRTTPPSSTGAEGRPNRGCTRQCF
mmetsp:Transcript_90032/g.197156  ORF Transcript_90032/g.197156 Transcript_90032/m.197156 type:complete len:381 (-) Transcript_90032:164-1306(-)